MMEAKSLGLIYKYRNFFPLHLAVLAGQLRKAKGHWEVVGAHPPQGGAGKPS